MFLRSCTSLGCQSPAERSGGSCMICAQHLCGMHAKGPLHACPKLDVDADAYYDAYDAAGPQYQDAVFSKINLAELCHVASGLRNVPCKVPNHVSIGDLLKAQMGGQNCHVDLLFDDGIVWIARLRLEAPYIAPTAVRDYITRSEVATLKFLEPTAVPSPRVYHHTVSDSVDKVGVPYVLMEKLPGKQLNWSEVKDPSIKQKIVSQLADIFIELKRHPLPLQGSLTEASPEQSPVIGQTAQPQLFITPTTSLGPFRKAKEAATSIADAFIELYASGELDDYAEASVVTHKWRAEVAQTVYGGTQSPQFYLKHNDDKGDHILVDDDFNITGIIDWEYASAECEQIAFASPCMLWSVADFYDGDNALSADESLLVQEHKNKGADDLAELVLRGRLHQRLWFFISGSPADYTELAVLFRALQRAYEGDETRQASEKEVEAFDTWKQEAWRKWGHDPRLQKVARRKRAEQRG